MFIRVLARPLPTYISTEAVVWRCSVKNVFLKISQNSLENTCARVSFLIKLYASEAWGLHLYKKRDWHRCFPVNFAKYLRTPFFTEHLWWLLLLVVTIFWRGRSYLLMNPVTQLFFGWHFSHLTDDNDTKITLNFLQKKSNSRWRRLRCQHQIIFTKLPPGLSCFAWVVPIHQLGLADQITSF